MRPSSLLLVLLVVVAATSLTGAQRHRYRVLHATLGSPAPGPPAFGPEPPSSGRAPLGSACYLLRPCSPAPSSTGQSADQTPRPGACNEYSIRLWAGERIPQMNYLLQLSWPTSEKTPTRTLDE